MKFQLVVGYTKAAEIFISPIAEVSDATHEFVIGERAGTAMLLLRKERTLDYLYL